MGSSIVNPGCTFQRFKGKNFMGDSVEWKGCVILGDNRLFDCPTKCTLHK